MTPLERAEAWRNKNSVRDKTGIWLRDPPAVDCYLAGWKERGEVEQGLRGEPECSELHHPKKWRHEWDELCPVVAAIRALDGPAPLTEEQKRAFPALEDPPKEGD